jgi:hypothetical protein
MLVNFQKNKIKELYNYEALKNEQETDYIIIEKNIREKKNILKLEDLQVVKDFFNFRMIAI